MTQRHIAFTALTLTLLANVLLSPCPAKADLVFETESNDSFATANSTIGFNNLGFAGTLTIGDIDTFTIRVTPFNGVAAIEWDNTWTPAPGSVPSAWHQVSVFRPNGISTLGRRSDNGETVTSHSTVTSIMSATDLTLFMQVFSTFPDPAAPGQIVPSMVAGTYSITNLRGLNGTIVTGTTAPEPGSLALLLPVAGTVGLVIRKRRKN